MLLKLLKSVDRFIIASLVVMMTLVLIFASVDLGWMLIRDLFFHQPMLLLSVDELLDIFGLFMLVLIGIELVQTVVSAYMMQESSHVEVVLSVAIIAIARKVIILDVKNLPPLTLIGIGAVTICLCAGYYLLRKVRMGNRNKREKATPPDEGGETGMCP